MCCVVSLVAFCVVIFIVAFMHNMVGDDSLFLSVFRTLHLFHVISFIKLLRLTNVVVGVIIVAC